MTSVLLPDEVFFALNRFLGLEQSCLATDCLDPCADTPANIESQPCNGPAIVLYRNPMRLGVPCRNFKQGSGQNADYRPSKCCGQAKCAITVPSCKNDASQNQSQQPQQWQQPCERSQSAPPMKFNYHFGINTISPKPQKPETKPSCESKVSFGNCSTGQNGSSRGPWQDTSQMGSSYITWQSQQQPECQRPCTSDTWGDDNDYIQFNPGLNSTMIDQKSQSSTQQSRRNQSSRGEPCMAAQNRSTGSQQKSRRQKKSETPEMSTRYMECEKQKSMSRNSQFNNTFDETSYMELPKPKKSARISCPVPDQGNSQPQNNCCQNSSMNQESFRSERSFRTCSSQQPPDNRSHHRSQGSFYENPNESTFNRSQSYQKCNSCTSQMNAEESIQNSGHRSMYLMKSPEDRLEARIQNEFLEHMVKDSYNPGLIQGSLNGSEDFNRYAFDIAFGGAQTDKPWPVDPITMIEAIKLRIDLERDEVRKHKEKEWEKNQKPNDKKQKPMGPVHPEDVNRYFEKQNKSDLNRGLAAFLRAETESKKSENNEKSKPGNDFQADVTRMDTRFFDDQINLSIFNATTRPT